MRSLCCVGSAALLALIACSAGTASPARHRTTHHRTTTAARTTHRRTARAMHDQVTVERWGKTPDGSQIYLYTLTNAAGNQVKISNYGGIVTQILVPDRRGNRGDIVLGYSTLGQYTKPNNSPYFGALIGRYGNRIAKGTFTLDGKTYHLPVNNGPNSLHGGIRGFDKRVWAASPYHTNDGVGLGLRYLSPNGEEGYPGNLRLKVNYTWTDDNALRITYHATTDRDTVLNLTNHSYFNLAGAGNGTILDHRLWLNANSFTPVDSTLIPTGKIQPVRGTPFDFTYPTAVGARINQNNQQLVYGKGYDHNFVLNHRDNSLIEAARVYCPRSGRSMEVFTTQPGVQFYTGNFLDGTNVGIGGKYVHRGALCLETQHFPDSPNHPNFPTSELKPGQVYHQVTVYRFYSHR